MNNEINKRQARAKHELLDEGGVATKKMTEAVGYRYTDLATEEAFEINVSAMSDAAKLMLAIFGAKTLATNEASQVRNGAKETDCTEVESVQERFDLLEGGTWREASEGSVGKKVDRDKLAQAVVEAQRALGHERDYGEVRGRLEPGVDEKFFRGCRKAADVTEIYNKLMGKDAAPVSSADLF